MKSKSDLPNENQLLRKKEKSGVGNLADLLDTFSFAVYYDNEL